MNYSRETDVGASKDETLLVARDTHFLAVKRKFSVSRMDMKTSRGNLRLGGDQTYNKAVAINPTPLDQVKSRK